MKIAVDAMGGDNAPKVVIDGVLQARDTFEELEFLVFGDREKIEPLITDQTNIKIVHTTEKINGDDEPVKAIRTKKTASMVLAAQAVKAQEADALLSLGNTGALLAAGLFVIGRIKGIERPGLMPTLPTVSGNDGFNLLDAGANAEAKAKHLQQYALMGQLYAQDVRGIQQPKVALLNNGTEATKGDSLHKETYELLQQDQQLNFIGNVEASQLLNGVADVVVTDGFTGNAALKAIEGTATVVMKQVKQAVLNAGIKGKVGGLLLKNSLGDIKTKFDTSIYGGAVFLGLKAPVVKAHGSADAKAVYYAITQIKTMVDQQTTQKFVAYFNENKTDNKAEPSHLSD